MQDGNGRKLAEEGEKENQLVVNADPAQDRVQINEMINAKRRECEASPDTQQPISPIEMPIPGPGKPMMNPGLRIREVENPSSTNKDLTTNSINENRSRSGNAMGELSSSRELPSDYQLRKALGLARRSSRDHGVSRDGRNPRKKTFDIADILTQEQIRSQLQNAVLFEGELFKYKPGMSISYMSRWCQVTRSQFMYFDDKWGANCWLRKPILVIPLRFVKAVQRVAVNVEDSKKAKQRKIARKKANANVLDDFQFELYLKDDVDLGSILQFNEVTMREEQRKEQMSRIGQVADANNNPSRTLDLPAGGTEHRVQKADEETPPPKADDQKRSPPDAKPEDSAKAEQQTPASAREEKKEPANVEEGKNESQGTPEVKVEDLEVSEPRDKPQDAIPPSTPPQPAVSRELRATCVGEPEVLPGHLMRTPHSRPSSRDPERSGERPGLSTQRYLREGGSGDLHLKGEQRELQDYNAFEGENAGQLRNVVSREDITIKNPSAWLPSLCSMD